MIVIDTSALMAILLDEPQAETCLSVITTNTSAISAATLTELLIVSQGRGISEATDRFLGELGPEIVPVTAESAKAAAQAYRRWGKGMHPASLNFGDCFAYALAIERDCPLLYIGGDFALTDVVSALT